MGNYIESKHSTPITSPAVSRLVKAYGHYIRDCLINTEPIETVQVFYNRMVKIKEMNKSRIYEKYLCDLSNKQQDTGK